MNPEFSRNPDDSETLLSSDESRQTNVNVCGATAAQRRARKEDDIARKEEHVKHMVGDMEIELDPKLIMHDDNTVMIQVCRSAKHGQMKSIGRTFGVSIRSLHEATQREDFALGPIQSECMVADIHTKAYSEAKASEWAAVRRNAGILSPAEFDQLIGTPGIGWQNRSTFPGKYVSRISEEDGHEVVACATSVERDAYQTLWRKKDNTPISIAAD